MVAWLDTVMGLTVKLSVLSLVLLGIWFYLFANDEELPLLKNVEPCNLTDAPFRVQTVTTEDYFKTFACAADRATAYSGMIEGHLDRQFHLDEHHKDIERDYEKQIEEVKGLKAFQQIVNDSVDKQLDAQQKHVTDCVQRQKRAEARSAQWQANLQAGYKDLKARLRNRS